jgi:membrane-bound serine protease (ClpP class)
VVAFVVGSIILLDRGVPGFEIARSLIGGMAAAGALIALLIVMYFTRSRRRPVITGAEQLLEEPAVAMADFDHAGLVRIRGETWNAVTHRPVRNGQRLRVIRLQGLTLEVEPDEHERASRTDGRGPDERRAP